jgi:hypothetical protein
MLLPFTKFFEGFERVQAVRKIFGDETDEVIRNLKVEFCTNRFGYMAVSHKDAHLIVSRWHLRNSDIRTIYLDLIHELFHVGQFRHERNSFIEGYERLVRIPEAYFTNPIEVAAYRHTVEEAKRIGLTDIELEEYLSVPWASQRSFRIFLRSVGLVGRAERSTKPIEIPVRISNRAPLTLYPFTNHFRGFEKVPGVRRLFGDETEDVLSKVKVEFSSHPLNYVQMSQEDGHLEVSEWHLRDSDMSVLYLDIFLYLQFVNQFLQGRWETSEFAYQITLSGFKFGDAEFEDYVARANGFDDYAEMMAASKLPGFGFPDVPLAIEAYRATVAEGRRIGMSEAELAEYVYAPAGPMTSEAHGRFLRNLGISQRKSKVRRN